MSSSEPPPLKPCTDAFPDHYAAGNYNPYRYFNQPIEQIPGWDSSQSQVLFHGASNGLIWQTVPDCVEVVECITGVVSGVQGSSSEDYEIKMDITERRIRPLQDLGRPSGTEDPQSCANISIPLEPIDVVTCLFVDTVTNSLKIQRKRVYVVKSSNTVGGLCPDISLEECSPPGSTAETLSAVKLDYDPNTKSWKYVSTPPSG